MFFCIYQWDELYATKPDDDYEDPADVAAIKEAKDNMGDYKLKTATDYVVPDHLRMNVDKARGRLLILKDLVGIIISHVHHASLVYTGSTVFMSICLLLLLPITNDCLIKTHFIRYC